jgi:hypothetical protein
MSKDEQGGAEGSRKEQAKAGGNMTRSASKQYHRGAGCGGSRSGMISHTSHPSDLRSSSDEHTAILTLQDDYAVKDTNGVPVIMVSGRAFSMTDRKRLSPLSTPLHFPASPKGMAAQGGQVGGIV